MKDIEALAQFVKGSHRMVVFTGAGISTESGIPDFRSKGGIWDRYQPVYFEEFLNSESKREEYWRQKFELFEQFGTAAPNAGHRAIVEIERMGKLRGLITQNIDGLHQMAGSDPERVLEIHGSNRQTVCLSCEERLPWEEVYERLKKGERAPRCLDCGGLIKPATISFGQALDPEVLGRASDWVRDCDLCLAVGSTLVVEPAASLPVAAKDHGARFVIVNLSATPVDPLADLVVRGKAGTALVQAINLLRGKDPGRTEGT